MSDVTHLIEAAQKGDHQAAADLLPLVYDELRQLGAAKMAGESPGHTLNATALVHEAYVRLVGDRPFADRSHFFRVAAEAMRRILIDRARQKRRIRHGGDREQVPLSDVEVAAEAPADELLALGEALDRFAATDPVKAELVKLRYFAGLSEEEAAAALGISRATASRYWTYARAWLINALTEKRNNLERLVRRAVAKRRLSKRDNRTHEDQAMADTADLTESIFAATVALANAEERAAYIDQACGGDAALRGRVEALLRAHERAGHLLDQPVPGGPERTGAYIPNAQPGTVIAGRYKLLEAIGEGGMGAVWVAEQTRPVRRKVALKLIKPGMDSKSVLARFEAERQALAVMDHPNIAKVLDGGLTEWGRPFFVMEYVKGVPITEYCDTARLSVPERLNLFVQVCQAVQHAHQKGIIHRDLKPTNILVAPYDDKPVPKVIDFGLAKAMHQSLTERTLHTAHETTLGTPLYMSPEQAKLNNLDVDTRSDIYSLGVLLYELLTGTTPLELQRCKEAAWEEIKRLVREEEPPRPSTRLSSRDTLASLAAVRHTEPARLTKLVRGELDWIVMKSLEKDRTRRYETANAFAADLVHYLNDEPVQACPPSATYRFGKFARRNRVAITTVTLVAAALVLGTIVSVWQAIRAETALTAEAEERRIAETQRSEAQKQRELADANFQRARKAVDEYFTLVSESKLLDVPGMQPLRKELLEAALRYYQAMRNERADDPGVLADLAVGHLHISKVYHELDRNDDALAALESAIQLAERLRRDYPNAVEQHRRLAGYWKVYRPENSRTQMPKDPVAADRTLIRFLQLWEAYARENPSVEGFQSDMAAISNLLASLESGRALAGDPTASFARAIAYSNKATAIWEHLSQPHPDVPAHRENLVRAYSELSSTLFRAGNVAQAREASARAVVLQEKLTTEFPNVPAYRDLSARKLVERASDLADSRPREGEEAFRQALKVWQRLATDFPAAHEYTIEFARAQIKFAVALAGPLKRPDDAIRVFQEGNEKLKKLAAEFPAEPRYRRELASGPRELAKRLSDLGIHLRDAEKLHLQSVATFNELAMEFPKDLSYVEPNGQSYRYLGFIARDTGRPDDAIAYLEKGIVTYQKLAEADLPRKDGYRKWEADTLKELAIVLTAGGHIQEAETAYRRAISLREPLAKASPDHRLAQANDYNNLGFVILRSKRVAEAERDVRAGLQLKQALASEFPDKPEYRYHLAHSCLGLSYILVESGRTSDAVQAASEADRLLKGLASDASALAVLRDQLGHTLWQLGETWTRLNRSEDALQANQRALESFQQLAADHPENLYYRQEQGVSHRKLADLMDHDGRSADAELQLRAALVCYQKLVAESPDSAFYRQEAAIVDCGLANLLLRTGQADEAAGEYTKTFEMAPASWSKIIDSLKARGRPAESAKVVRQLITVTDKRADEVQARIYRGALHRELGELDKAIADFSSVIAQDPKLTDPWDLRGSCHLRKGEFAAAAEDYSEAIKLKPGNSWYWHERAFAYMVLGKHRESIADHSEVIRLSDHDPGTRLRRGDCYRALGEWTKAEIDYTRAIELYSGLWEAWQGRGLTYLQLKQNDKAASDFAKVVELAPKSAVAHYNLGNALKAMGDLDAAVAAYRAAAAAHEKKNPADAGGLYSAACYRALTAAAQATGPDAAPLVKDEADRAMAWLTKAVAAGFANFALLNEDSDLDALRDRADFRKLLADVEAKASPVAKARYYILRSQWDKAADEYAKADLLTQPLRDDAFAYACLYLIRGDSEGYDRFCQGMIQRAAQTKDYFEAFVLTRTCAVARKSPVDPARAVEWGKQAVAGDQPGWYFHALGLAQCRAGQFEQALESFAKADVEAWAYRDLNWFGLALVQHRLGHPDEARQCFDKGLQWLQRYGSPGPTKPATIHPIDWVEAQVLRREAEELLKVKQSP